MHTTVYIKIHLGNPAPERRVFCTHKFKTMQLQHNLLTKQACPHGRKESRTTTIVVNQFNPLLLKYRIKGRFHAKSHFIVNRTFCRFLMNDFEAVHHFFSVMVTLLIDNDFMPHAYKFSSQIVHKGSYTVGMMKCSATNKSNLHIFVFSIS